MVFILDQAIAHTLVRNGGKHAFYDWICWEYLVGLPRAPFSFEFEDVATYQHKVEKDKRDVFTTREVRWEVNIPEAHHQYDRIVTRWCFPTRAFLIEVIDFLQECLLKCFQWANYEKTQHRRFDKDQGGSGEWDPDKGYVRIFNEVYKYIPEDDKRDRYKEPWTEYGEFEEWWKFKRAQLHEELQKNEKLDPELTASFFGWDVAGTPKDSLCGVLMRSILGFVQESERLEIGADKAKQTVPYEDQIKGIAAVGKLFRPHEFWWYLQKSERDLASSHGVNKSPRVDPLECAKGEACNNFLVTLKQKVQGGRHHYDGLKFQTAMFLSGYHKAAIGNALESQKNHFRDVKLLPFKSAISFDHEKADFRFDKYLKGEWIVSKNWNAIEHYVLRSLESDALREEPEPPTEQARLEGGMIPSDSVKQPRGTEPEKTKAKKEEDASMVPIIVGAGALLAFMVLAR